MSWHESTAIPPKRPTPSTPEPPRKVEKARLFPVEFNSVTKASSGPFNALWVGACVGKSVELV
jgi:hypothetical protein